MNQPNLEVTIAKIVLGLVSTWIIAWTPYALVALAGISGYQSLLTPFSSMLPALFCKTAACIDPFIYALNHPKIRNEIFFRVYKNLVGGRRGESGMMSESGRPTFDRKTANYRRCSGPSSRRAKSFPGKSKDAISFTSPYSAMVQRPGIDTDDEMSMKEIRRDDSIGPSLSCLPRDELNSNIHNQDNAAAAAAAAAAAVSSPPPVKRVLKTNISTL